MMTSIQRSALLPYAVDKIYQLINDVTAYPQFMDGCVGAELLSQSEGHMQARLDLSKLGFSYSFTTRNELYYPTKVVMHLVDGPFSQFQGEWQLQALGDEACKVSLQMDFELRGAVLSLAAKKVFEPMANNLVDAIVKRAQQLYG
ncbi:type II toxin-antitoxin system RatA family toxin [Dasania marina]|uniref:type II toxin-antitoxin system RatA family toxin n=1 Tax=Dasania marina TaxID=471499 RepID=UPI0004BA847A|nr:type II toxin-antitoxin system RatA family toxin [Dasania marina]